jgi:ABC-type microcin C transport system permease subunit YejE
MGFIIGLFIGAIIGFFTTALCMAGGTDEWKE